MFVSDINSVCLQSPSIADKFLKKQNMIFILGVMKTSMYLLLQNNW